MPTLSLLLMMLCPWPHPGSSGLSFLDLQILTTAIAQSRVEIVIVQPFVPPARTVSPRALPKWEMCKLLRESGYPADVLEMLECPKPSGTTSKPSSR